MNVLSKEKLAKTIKNSRELKNLTQEELGKETNINRAMIGRIERKEFIPSIKQLEALSKTLDFEISDMFVDEENKNSFLALRSKSLNDVERKGVEKIISMMLTLRQQIRLNEAFENETK